MFQFDNTQTGSVFIGMKVYENAKMSEALKVFENVPGSYITSSATAALVNTNAGSIQVSRG